MDTKGTHEGFFSQSHEAQEEDNTAPVTYIPRAVFGCACRVSAQRGSGSALLWAGPGSNGRKWFLTLTRSLGPSVHRTELPGTVLAKDMLRNNIWARTG